MHVHLLHNLKAGRRLGTFLVAALVWMVAIPAAWAQGRTVTGTVTAQEDNTPLPGVTVLVKGTTTGTATGADGTYSINVPGDNATLVFSFIGYQSREFPVGNQSAINASLTSDVQALGEVVVIGYGTQRKKDATGSVVALDAKEFNKGVIASPEQLLQGRAAGVQITPASGEPGAGINIRVRGTTSVRSGNNPLFVVDGVPLDGGNSSDGGRDYGAGSQSARNPLNFINPEDIESISILKDASAAAIYGSRAANGVVLITTKKGKSGQQTLNFSANGSIATRLKKYDVLSAEEFLPALQRAGGDPTAAAVNGGSSTNWQDEIFRPAYSQIYNLNYGGGNDNTRYFFSLGYQDQEGILKKSGLQRTTGRVNASHDLFDDRVVIDLNMTSSGIRDAFAPTGENAGYQGNILGAALQTNPTYPIFDDQGRYFTPNGYDEEGKPRGEFRNPVAMLNNVEDVGTTYRTLANISATWKIFNGLSYKLNFGIDNSSAERKTDLFRNTPGFLGNNQTGFAAIQNRKKQMQLIEHTLNYNQKVGIGTLDALAGFSYQRFREQYNFVSATFFLPEADGFFPYSNNIGFVDNKDDRKAFSGESNANQSELQSLFGRLNYNIADKYLITATYRLDGSSKFGPNNKYAGFPSLAFAWRLSNESFMPQGLFSDLKIRTNWGITGNQEFPSNRTQALRNPDPNNAGAPPAINANENLRWESTTQWGVGLDYAFLDGRLSGSLDYFNKNTEDLLFEAIQAQPAAAPRRWINFPGSVINSGVEFAVAYDVLREKRLGWNVAYNMTFLRNEVQDFNGFYPTGAISGQGLSGAYAQRITSGRPLYAFYLPTFTGFDEQGFGTYTDPALGNEYVGSPIPTFNFGFTNSFTYGNWSLSAFLTGATGFYVYNNTANALFIKGSLRNGRNVTREAANSVENSVNPPVPSTRFLEKGDFVRLSNATLGYSFKMPSGGFIKNLNVSLTGQNLLLFTNYSGVDPEVNTNKAINDVPSLNIDYTSFPTARTITLGLNAGF